MAVGVGRPLGVEIASALQACGLTVIEELAVLPPDAVLEVLAVNLTMAGMGVPFHSVTVSDMHAALDSQLYAFVASVQAAVPRMAAGSAIVQIVSKAYLGSWDGVHIAASAAACVAMARSMAIELAPLGVRVNSVAAGRPGESWDNARARSGISAAVAWLAGEDSRDVTGETILADRGASLQMAQAARR